ncbi:MAG: inositol oxygenase [Candidatus Solibacter usitatus]|nr:inositol oxygenase [Candidatus Solibacter usitatus]
MSPDVALGKQQRPAISGKLSNMIQDTRYNPARKPEEFRQHDEGSPGMVKEFYRLNHRLQTLDFVLAKKREYLPPRRQQMGIWELMDLLDTLVDESDPDTDLSQTQHNLQAAEAARRDGQPRWFILAGLIHDLGKILCLFGEPQWAVVGDTFPVGCAYSDKVVYFDYFQDNPDRLLYTTPCGIYQEGCGLDQVHMSWGHDEYMYHVTAPYLPEEAQYIIRYHSFYPCHQEGAYQHLMNGRDREMFHWVKEFARYDLYSKSDRPADAEAVRPYYDELIREFLPGTLQW